MDYTKYANEGVHAVDSVLFTRAGGSTSLGAVYAAVDTVVSSAGRAAKAIYRKLQERAAIRELSGLEDRILNDIGVPRSEIHIMVRKMMENPGLDHRTFR